MNGAFVEVGDKHLPPVVLLHGTGGDEFQLIPLAHLLFPNHPILSIRGRISERGVNRYFKLNGLNFSKDNYDLNSLSTEEEWLSQKIEQLIFENKFDASKMIAMGYSNGANVAIHLQQKGKINFLKIIAFHATQLEDIKSKSRHNSTKIWISHADNDVIVSSNDFNELIQNLNEFGYQTEIFKSASGHQLTQVEVEAVKKWINEN